MLVFVMRHGQAEPHADSDASRALTSYGVSEVAASAKQYLLDHAFDYVFVSPYLRAQQSWQTIQEQGLQYTHLKTVDWITPEASVSMAMDELLAIPGSAEKILLVCHQPFVGKFTTCLCDGNEFGLPIATAGITVSETDVLARECGTLLGVYGS